MMLSSSAIKTSLLDVKSEASRSDVSCSGIAETSLSLIFSMSSACSWPKLSFVSSAFTSSTLSPELSLSTEPLSSAFTSSPASLSATFSVTSPPSSAVFVLSVSSWSFASSSFFSSILLI